MISDRILTIFSPTSARLPAYIFGSLAIGVLINYLTNLVSDNDVASIAIIVGLALLAFYFVWRGKDYKLHWGSGNVSKQSECLITLLSTPDTIKTLLTHHKGKLQHLWIITNFKQGPYSHFFSDQLPALLQSLNMQKIQHHPIHFDDDQRSNIQESYEAVKKAVGEAIKSNFSADQIVVDITSGTKEMTAGVVIACIENNWHMTYVRSEYLWDDDNKKSNRISGSEQVLEIKVDFVREQPV